MFPLRDTIPSRHPPVMTIGIIIVNAIVFYFQLGLSQDRLEELFRHLGVVPAHYMGSGGHSPQFSHFLAFWPFITCMFLHGGWVHVISNMWCLWVFGDNVEDRMGPAKYLGFYLVCGIAASLAHVIVNGSSTMPIVGASGAIAGVMGAYMLMYPSARVVTLVLIIFYPLFIEVPAFVFLLLWFLGQFFSGMLMLGAKASAGGIAWWAHIGGFGSGALLCWFFTDARRSRNIFRRNAD